jgi:HEAT repeat protein
MKRLVLLSMVWLAIEACISAQQPGRGQPPAGGVPNVVDAWLECVECRDSELQAVVKLGPSAITGLSPALLNGPPPAKVQSYEKYLRQIYADMKAYEKTHPKSVVPYTEDEFVKRDMAKYMNLYRVRAARALGDIGGPQAAAALEQALKLPMDPYVLTKVKEARAKIK